MVDENKTYTNPESAGTDEYSSKAVTGGTENMKSILTSKRFLSVIGIIVAVFFLFVKRGPTENPKKNETPPIITAEAQPHIIESPPVIAPVVEAVKPVELLPIQAALKHDVAAIQEMNAQVQNLVSRLQQVEENVTSIATKQDTATNAIKDMNTQLEAVDSTLKKMMEPKKVVKPKKLKRSAPLPIYYIHALVEGRAWVTRGDKNYTVTVGDVLPGYGTVTSVLPDAGVIETSSGREIIFERNDI